MKTKFRYALIDIAGKIVQHYPTRKAAVEGLTHMQRRMWANGGGSPDLLIQRVAINEVS